MNSSTSTERPVRREEVARRAGVSAMTVTRALHGGPVKAQTRERILRVCEELGYRVNLQAQGLRLNKSWLIGLVVSTVKHEYWSRVIDTLERHVQAAGYHLLIAQTSRYFDLEEVEFLLARNLDGLLVATPAREETIVQLLKQPQRIVLYNQAFPDLDVSFVGADNRGGVRQAVAYLAELGHRRIACLRGWEGEHTAEERMAGYREGLTAAGLTEDPDLVAVTNFDYEGGSAAIHQLLDRNVSFTAVLGANDYVALGAMSALHERGLRVPMDVSVIGFAGDVAGRYSIPALTTLHEPAEEMVKEAVELLLAPESAKLPAGRRLPVELVLRASCGPVNN